MSRVISFRLDENDPDEQRALAILEAGSADGFSVREMITQALLKAGGRSPAPKADLSGLAAALHTALREVHALADKLQGGAPPVSQTAPKADPLELSDTLIASVKRNLKPGLKRR